jgi:hypothetical protein
MNLGPTKECPGTVVECPGTFIECPGVGKECPGEITLIITLVTNKITYFMKD